MQAFKKILFFIILFLSFAGMSYKIQVVLLQNDDFVQSRNKSTYRILNEPENSIDMVVVGDSLSYTSVSPMELWKDYGITSYVCGQSGQTIQETFHMLENVFKTQSPKLIVLETHTLFKKQDGIKGIKNTLEEWGNYNIPLLRGHDVWKSYLAGKRYTENSYKGFSFRCNIESYKKGDYMFKTEEIQTIPEISISYMDKILKLCREHNAELLLFSAPSPKNYNYSRHNSIRAYAQKHALEYLNMNLKLQAAGINWKIDSLDHGDHLNFLGAQKVTRYLGKYLDSHHKLPDHRGEQKYTSWEKLEKQYEVKAQKCLKQML